MNIKNLLYPKELSLIYKSENLPIRIYEKPNKDDRIQSLVSFAHLCNEKPDKSKKQIEDANGDLFHSREIKKIFIDDKKMKQEDKKILREYFKISNITVSKRKDGFEDTEKYYLFLKNKREQIINNIKDFIKDEPRVVVDVSPIEPTVEKPKKNNTISV